jgi:serine/threonine-protein kinase
MPAVQLGKYRLIRKLGAGGMGEVWEGMLDGERGFERRVAVKCMAATGDAYEARFLSEARIASKLHHANIVSVLDFGVHADTWYQVLELINGTDAHHLMDRSLNEGHAVPIGLALHICAETAHGLSAAHTAADEKGRSLGIVHRDVSLDNILISWAGDVKLSDFGVAKAKDQAHTTIAGATVGKISYMAPEQATAGDIDARADVFALGCALHALLTGRTPLAGEAAMLELLAGKPLELAPELPDDVAAIVQKAVRLRRTERFQSAAEMADALARARHERLHEDPRSALAKYLEHFKPAATPVRVGALDALLAPQSEAGPLSETQRERSPLAATVSSSPRPRLAVFGFIAAAALGASGVFAFKLTRPEATEPAPVVKREPPPPIAELPADVVLEPRSSPEPQPQTDSPAPAPVAPSQKPAVPKGRGQQPRAKVPAPAGQGIVAVGGPKAQRAEILVDGHSEGYAPKRLELSCGAHEITLVTPQGEHIGPHRVEVTQLHTELEPLKWIVE